MSGAVKHVSSLGYFHQLAQLPSSTAFEEGLQAQFGVLNVYCDEWELNINTDEIKIMIISNKS